MLKAASVRDDDDLAGGDAAFADGAPRRGVHSRAAAGAAHEVPAGEHEDGAPPLAAHAARGVPRLRGLELPYGAAEGLDLALGRAAAPRHLAPRGELDGDGRPLVSRAHQAGLAV